MIFHNVESVLETTTTYCVRVIAISIRKAQKKKRKHKKEEEKAKAKEEESYNILQEIVFLLVFILK